MSAEQHWPARLAEIRERWIRTGYDLDNGDETEAKVEAVDELLGVSDRR